MDSKVKRKTLIVITGPTASGKSALAVDVAKRLDTEIISADSRQIYKGIPIVTAVPTEAERGGVRHHLLETLELDQYFSASEFENESLRLLDRIFRDRDVAVVCGGSVMYVDALCYGIDEMPTVPETLRSDLTDKWRRSGDEWLVEELRRLDPAHFSKVDLRNIKRVFHAVEVSITAGRPYSSLLTGIRADRPFKIIKTWINGEREILFNRINRRVEKMMENGLEEEALGVYDMRHLNSLNTVGLKEMFALFDGVFTREEAVARIMKNTRVYAKKQIAWLKRDEKAVCFGIGTTADKFIDSIMDARALM